MAQAAVQISFVELHQYENRVSFYISVKIRLVDVTFLDQPLHILQVRLYQYAVPPRLAYFGTQWSYSLLSLLPSALCCVL